MTHIDYLKTLFDEVYPTRSNNWAVRKGRGWGIYNIDRYRLVLPAEYDKVCDTCFHDLWWVRQFGEYCIYNISTDSCLVGPFSGKLTVLDAGDVCIILKERHNYSSTCYLDPITFLSASECNL